MPALDVYIVALKNASVFLSLNASLRFEKLHFIALACAPATGVHHALAGPARARSRDAKPARIAVTRKLCLSFMVFACRRASSVKPAYAHRPPLARIIISKYRGRPWRCNVKISSVSTRESAERASRRRARCRCRRRIVYDISAQGVAVETSSFKNLPIIVAFHLFSCIGVAS